MEPRVDEIDRAVVVCGGFGVRDLPNKLAADVETLRDGAVTIGGKVQVTLGDAVATGVVGAGADGRHFRVKRGSLIVVVMEVDGIVRDGELVVKTGARRGGLYTFSLAELFPHTVPTCLFGLIQHDLPITMIYPSRLPAGIPTKMISAQDPKQVYC